MASNRGRLRRWEKGATWQQIADSEGVTVPTVSLWAKNEGLAPNHPGGFVPRARRRLLQLAMAQFRQTRKDCESRGVPREQLDALEPFLKPMPKGPDPRPKLTPAQRATLLALADAHDHVLDVIAEHGW